MLSKGPTMLPEVPAMLSSEDPNSYPALRAAILSEVVPCSQSVQRDLMVSEGPIFYIYYIYRSC